jgi:hypothetical protein
MKSRRDAELFRIARDFWVRSQLKAKFPRDIDRAVCRALPVCIIRLPRLTSRTASSWLVEHGLAISDSSRDLPLRGLLIARWGRALIFVDGDDSVDEIRFSIAHELAHFLIEYWVPRQSIIQSIGDRAIEFLEGYRAPHAEERLAGILRGIQWNEFRCSTARASDGRFVTQAALDAEDLADQLALELLAPVAELFRENYIGADTDTAAEMSHSVIVACSIKFGLPKAVAHRYLTLMFARNRKRPTVRKWLGL